MRGNESFSVDNLRSTFFKKYFLNKGKEEEEKRKVLI